MSPVTLTLLEQLLRLAKGMCTACEVWLHAQKIEARKLADQQDLRQMVGK